MLRPAKLTTRTCSAGKSLRSGNGFEGHLYADARRRHRTIEFDFEFNDEKKLYAYFDWGCIYTLAQIQSRVFDLF